MPRFLKWRKTSKKELEEVDKKILDEVPSVKERKFVELDNGEQLWSITCNPDGKGTPIVMVHGMGGGVGLWALNLDAISEKRPVYAFDLLGFGRSSRPKFSVDALEAEKQFADAIEKYRIAMGLKEFILLGHSLGGFLCASYALSYPQHVKHLILADPWGMSLRPPEGGSTLPWYIRSLVSIFTISSPLSIVRAAGPFGPQLVRKYRPALAETFATKLKDETILHSYVYHCNAQNPSGELGFKSMTWNLGWAKEPMTHRLIEGLDDNVPLTFIYGSESWVKRSTGWEIKNERSTYVDVQIIRGAGHHVYADRANLFNTLVNTIAESVDKGELPQFNEKLTHRIHATPTVVNFHPPTPSDPDIQRPQGYVDKDITEL